MPRWMVASVFGFAFPYVCGNGRTFALPQSTDVSTLRSGIYGEQQGVGWNSDPLAPTDSAAAGAPFPPLGPLHTHVERSLVRPLA